MAFVDTILQETDASVVVVDRRAVPGGHWNDAYLFVNGFPADSISWVVPRDSWFWTRRSFQPSMDFFDPAFGGLAQQYEAMATAASTDELCLEMERIGRWVRIDPTVQPTMFHAAILPDHEVEALGTVNDVIRHGRCAASSPVR